MSTLSRRSIGTRYPVLCHMSQIDLREVDLPYRLEGMEHVMEKAIRAKQVITRIVQRTDDSLTIHMDPDLEDLPEWVQDAWDDGMFLMIADDGYTGLWVANAYGYALRAEGNDILVNRGEGHVGLWQDLN